MLQFFADGHTSRNNMQSQKLFSIFEFSESNHHKNGIKKIVTVRVPGIQQQLLKIIVIFVN